ncbi:hypothetical protein BcDW1_548 [Botrytis cinerea BcDW1]|nr:hypothetical protein BcDW1_548 [Botrytis cinerea BcDW1]
MCKKCGHTNCRLVSSSKASSSKRSSSGNRSDGSEKSDKSKSSEKSGTSGKSANSKSSVKTASSGLSQLTTLAQTISEDLRQASEALETLVNNWKIDNENLTKYTPDYDSSKWTKQMRQKHNDYHKYDDNRKKSMGDFKNHYKNHCKNDPTSDDFKKLRALAIKWADDALTVAEARLQFSMENKAAYKDHKAMKGHLDQIENMINSAKNALSRQKQTKATILDMTAKASDSR